MRIFKIKQLTGLNCRKKHTNKIKLKFKKYKIFLSVFERKKCELFK